ncbi:MAG: hypothetical protein OJF52_001241 [Nitrospira sp.]|jgi:hypothetical protein|nr:MAG: hypothetical protein OJF52_001241 [Nitrospira sp.]
MSVADFISNALKNQYNKLFCPRLFDIPAQCVTTCSITEAV